MTDYGLDFLLDVMQLKDEKRTGWEKRGISYPESVAAHSFGTALLTWLLADRDEEKAIKMALAHDLHEAISGDIPSGGLDEAAYQEKKEQEHDAFDVLVSDAGIEVDELTALWKEYEDRETETEKFVKDMDLLDMVIQAYLYEKQQRYESRDEFLADHRVMDEFFEHARPQLQFDTSKQLFEQIYARHQEEE